MYGSDQEAGWAEAASSLSAGPLDDPDRLAELREWMETRHASGVTINLADVFEEGRKVGRAEAAGSLSAGPLDSQAREALMRLEGAVQDYIDDPKTMTPLYLEVRNARLVLARLDSGATSDRITITPDVEGEARRINDALNDMLGSGVTSDGEPS